MKLIFAFILICNICHGQAYWEDYRKMDSLKDDFDRFGDSAHKYVSQAKKFDLFYDSAMHVAVKMKRLKIKMDMRQLKLNSIEL